VPAGNGEHRNQSPTWRDAWTLHGSSPPGGPSPCLQPLRSPGGRRPSFHTAQHGRSDLAVVRV